MIFQSGRTKVLRSPLVGIDADVPGPEGHFHRMGARTPGAHVLKGVAVDEFHLLPVHDDLFHVAVGVGREDQRKVIPRRNLLPPTDLLAIHSDSTFAVDNEIDIGCRGSVAWNHHGIERQPRAADGAAVHGCRFSGGGIYGIELSGIVLCPVEGAVRREGAAGDVVGGHARVAHLVRRKGGCVNGIQRGCAAVLSAVGHDGVHPAACVAGDGVDDLTLGQTGDLFGLGGVRHACF